MEGACGLTVIPRCSALIRKFITSCSRKPTSAIRMMRPSIRSITGRPPKMSEAVTGSRAHLLDREAVKTAVDEGRVDDAEKDEQKQIPRRQPAQKQEAIVGIAGSKLPRRLQGHHGGHEGLERECIGDNRQQGENESRQKPDADIGPEQVEGLANPVEVHLARRPAPRPAVAGVSIHGTHQSVPTPSVAVSLFAAAAPYSCRAEEDLERCGFFRRNRRPAYGRLQRLA